MSEAVEHVIKEEVRVKLYQSDVGRLGKELAEVTQERNQLEARRGELQSTLASQIKAFNVKINELSSKINQGYEMREVECIWLMDTPRTGLKTLVRKDNNEELRSETMTQADAQLGMDLQPAPEEPPVEDEGKAGSQEPGE